MPSAVCVLWLIFACIQLSVLKASEEKKNLIIIEQGKGSFYHIDRMTRRNLQMLKASDISSNPSLKLFIPYYLSAHLFVILSIKVLTDQCHCPNTAAKWLKAHRIAQ